MAASSVQALPVRRELGMLIVVIIKAQHLHDPRHFSKQDCLVTIEHTNSDPGMVLQTRLAKGGGQHPVWDEEFRMRLFEPLEGEQPLLKLRVLRQEHKDEAELVGEAHVLVDGTWKEFDEWIEIKDGAGKYRGEIYVEMTFYPLEEEPNQRRKATNHLQRHPSKLEPISRTSCLPSRAACIAQSLASTSLSEAEESAKPLPVLPLPNQPSYPRQPQPAPLPLPGEPDTPELPEALRPGRASSQQERPTTEEPKAQPTQSGAEASQPLPFSGQHRPPLLASQQSFALYPQKDALTLPAQSGASASYLACPQHLPTTPLENHNPPYSQGPPATVSLWPSYPYQPTRPISQAHSTQAAPSPHPPLPHNSPSPSTILCPGAYPAVSMTPSPSPHHLTSTSPSAPYSVPSFHPQPAPSPASAPRPPSRSSTVNAPDFPLHSANTPPPSRSAPPIPPLPPRDLPSPFSHAVPSPPMRSPTARPLPPTPAGDARPPPSPPFDSKRTEVQQQQNNVAYRAPPPVYRSVHDLGVGTSGSSRAPAEEERRGEYQRDVEDERCREDERRQAGELRRRREEQERLEEEHRLKRVQEAQAKLAARIKQEQENARTAAEAEQRERVKELERLARERAADEEFVRRLAEEERLEAERAQQEREQQDEEMARRLREEERVREEEEKQRREREDEQLARHFREEECRREEEERQRRLVEDERLARSLAECEEAGQVVR